MSDKTIYAWTDVANYKYYPQFINLSVSPQANKLSGLSGIRLYVRGPEHTDNDGVGIGVTAQLFLPEAALLKLANAIQEHFASATKDEP